METRIVSLIIEHVIDFTPFGKDPITGEVRLLLCNTWNEAFILDTRTHEKTYLVGSQELREKT